ncbi:MAG: SIS domain-containing protein [Firmicutes bacterium]|nr:SIS domain-containing protein [Bacillota bacterium]
MSRVRVLAKDYISELKAVVDKISLKEFEKIIEVLFKAYKDGKTVYILGNGGAASMSSHMACDLGKGTLTNTMNNLEKRFRVISLTDNVATMTAFSNDISFDDVFTQQLRNYITAGDVVIGISGSGNSLNVIQALAYAKQEGATTICLLGFYTGGNALQFADYAIVVQSKNYGIIEDLHLSLSHMLTICLSVLKQRADSQYLKQSSKKTVPKKTNGKANSHLRVSNDDKKNVTPIRLP